MHGAVSKLSKQYFLIYFYFSSQLGPHFSKKFILLEKYIWKYRYIYICAIKIQFIDRHKLAGRVVWRPSMEIALHNFQAVFEN
jgi:hypothetical protein